MGLFGTSYSSILAEYSRLVAHNIPADERKLDPKVLTALAKNDARVQKAKWKETMAAWKRDLIHLRNACMDYTDKSLFRADEAKKINEITDFCVNRIQVLNAALQNY